MTLLKNATAWKKWVKRLNDSQPQAPIAEKPAEYPCFVYTVVSSFGYEEEGVEFLYSGDLRKMQSDLVAAGIRKTP